MSATIYDEALLAKLKWWTSDIKGLTITGPNETKRLFEYIADITNDKPIELPLIALRRLSPITIQSTNKKPITFDGWIKDNTGIKANQLNAIPITLTYQLDIYTRYYSEAEEYVRNFTFNFINYPKLEIVVPYNGCNLPIHCNIRIQPDIDDNSDIPERLVPGEFTRKTFTLYIDDAYLFDFKTKDTWKVDPDTPIIVDIVDADTNIEVKEEVKIKEKD